MKGVYYKCPTCGGDEFRLERALGEFPGFAVCLGCDARLLLGVSLADDPADHPGVVR